MEKYYKAFNSDMTCSGKQYEENTTYEEYGNKICKKGMMHFCKNPFDVLQYYDLVDKDCNISQFAEVEPLGIIECEGNKSATNKLKIKIKIGLKGLINAFVEFVLEKTDDAKIGSSGDCAQIGSSGNGAVIMCAGYNSIAKAKKGSWITLAEYYYKNEEYVPLCVKTEYVDGKIIKEDTFYKLKGGVFVEYESN